jgi:hypothetical protein
MYDVSVTSLAHLPLPGIKRVCVHELECAHFTYFGQGRAAASHAHAAAVKLAAALAAAPHCTFPGTRLNLKCCVAQLPILLPLLARWHGMERLQLITGTGECLTPAAVAALGALLEGMPSCTQLNITGPTPHPSALLLPALVRTRVSTVWLNHYHMTDAHLLLWCAGGQPSHPITVKLLDGFHFVGDISLVRSTVGVPDSGVVLEDDVVDDGGINGDSTFEAEE